MRRRRRCPTCCWPCCTRWVRQWTRSATAPHRWLSESSLGTQQHQYRPRFPGGGHVPATESEHLLFLLWILDLLTLAVALGARNRAAALEYEQRQFERELAKLREQLQQLMQSDRPRERAQAV